MVGHQTVGRSFVLYHKCTATMPFRPKDGEVYTIIDATQAVLRQQFPYDEGMLQYFMLRNGVSTCIWKICPLRMTEDYIGYAFQILIVTMVSSTYMTVAEKYIFQWLLKGQLQRSCAPPYLRSL